MAKGDPPLPWPAAARAAARKCRTAAQIDDARPAGSVPRPAAECLPRAAIGAPRADFRLPGGRLPAVNAAFDRDP